MDNLITIVRDGMLDWEQEAPHTNRYSVFTEHLILAEKISKHQHLTPRASKLADDDEKSFHSATSKLPENNKGNNCTAPPADLPSTSTPVSSPNTSRPSSNQANVGRPRTNSQRTSKTAKAPSGEWTWRPYVPQRTSSMSTRRRKGKSPKRPDLATFHRRSCQLFSSLDSTLSSAISTATSTSTSRTNDSDTSTSPSLASSISTQATSILDDSWYNTPTTPTLDLELQDPRLSTQSRPRPGPDFGNFLDTVNERPRLTSRKSSSQLSPRITSTEQVFWTSDETRQTEYAKIDAAHSGFKGFMKRIIPRSWDWAHGKRRNFHRSSSPAVADDSSQTDCNSVRRYRLSIASATQEAIANAELHGVSTGQNTPQQPSSPSLTQQNMSDETPQGLGLQVSKIKKTSPTQKKFDNMKSRGNFIKFFRGISNTIDKEKRAKTLSRSLGY
ncbi:hypothetical protein H2198_003826 [Neophaeococcomyces mojaviensis]|uniref:Uncharacterized protein n=1 Tax=Neophaeococcomyces mojaviensis TaxID=3383035 RepID=A0ACC3AAC3_9EURO|nr:hypothetical protein H2198_003826 [Knufia sp. JES_112]